MNRNDNHNIPSMDLQHEDKDIDFALRTMEEIHAERGNEPGLPHRHNYYTILWSKNACGQHFIDYKEYIIKPHVIFFVNPGQVHQVITFGKPEGLIIMFTREFLQKNLISEEFITNLGLFSESSDTPPLNIEEKKATRLHELARQIQESFEDNKPFKNDMIGAYLKLFLIECNNFAPTPTIDNPQNFQAGTNILRSFKILIEEKFTQWHKVSDYAEALHISPDYLNNVIKGAIGKTAKEFIQERIILEAKRLGVHTHMSNKEIAYEIGFDDPSHFSKFFKNNAGRSFKEFRTALETA